MIHLLKKYSQLIKCFFILSILTAVFSSCTTLPKYPEVPKDLDQTTMAHIKLINADDSSFNENFGGENFNMTCLVIPYWIKAGAIAFDEQFLVYSAEEWENSSGSFLHKKYKFNDNAVFNIPAGEYKVCAYKITGYGSNLMQKCFNDKPFKFEAGMYYEMHISYLYNTESITGGIRRSWRMGIVDIRKVKEFKSTQAAVTK